MRSIIIGGGVAGCAIAAALRGVSGVHDSVMIERRAANDPAGMGFILMPNGLAALDAIAPEFDWRSAGRCIDRVTLCTHDGVALSDTTIDPAVCVSREKFLRMLRESASDTTTLEGASFEGLERSSNGSTTAVRLEDGARVEGDLFFGCDGARSKVRTTLFPHALLAPVAVMEIVSIAEAPALAARLGTNFRKFHDAEGGFAIGLLAESATRVVWFVQFDALRWTLANASAETLSSFIRERIAHWASEVTEAFNATDFTKSHLWPTRDLAPLASLACENLALVGDAAHACLPFTSQGANGALVDAMILRDELSAVCNDADVCRAFARYSTQRRPHHQRMFMEGRRLRAAFLAPLAQQHPVLPLVH